MRRLVPMLPMVGTALAAGLVLGAGDPGAAGGGGAAPAAEVLVEAEGFADLGGWVVDPQFMDVMGSAYLLAHGLGRPVAPARTDVAFPRPGAYRLWVRTKDWVPEHHPGRFTVVVDGKPAGAVFGTEGTGWLWQDGGTVQVAAARARVELVDMTGFEGRCDALYFAVDPGARPPAAPGPAMDAWRRRLLGLPDVPPSAGEFDVVVVGGGIAGTSAAVAAARLGCRVALVQDRPVLGGNASSEVRVHTGGQPGPRIVGEINATYDRGAGDEPHPTRRYDDRRLAVVEAEKNIRLFLNTRVFRVQAAGGRIASVDGRHARLGTETRFAAPVFIDCTGDGSVGAWAGAEFRVGREGRDELNESIAPEKADRMVLGTSLMWGSREADHASTFPAVPWGKEVAGDLEAVEGDWTWEYGHALDTIADAEAIRDHLLRAIYGAWANAKNGSNQARYARRELSHVPWIAGKRESRRLIGDYILTQADLQAARAFPDGVATGSWSIDLHYPQAQPFRTRAEFNPVAPYPIPFRCLYSKNVENLMMAGRDVSVTHVALGSARVMNTGGQMGVAVGVAAWLCKARGVGPRGVYEKHLAELLDILNGRGRYAGVLDPPAGAAAAAVAPAEASDVAVRTLALGLTRCTDRYEIVEAPEALRGLVCVTAARGPTDAPGAAFAFEIDAPATVFLAVHDRGDAGLPAGWQPAEGEIRWTSGDRACTDRLYRRDFARGRVEVPPHTGREGPYYGVPHMAIVKAAEGAKVAVTPAAAK